MAEDRDESPPSQTQSQNGGSQIHIDDGFHSLKSSETGTSSLTQDPSSYYSQTVAYGTNINVSAAATEIRKFFQTFTEEGSENCAVYMKKIEEMNTNTTLFFTGSSFCFRLR
jgi:hypothetical protein